MDSQKRSGILLLILLIVLSFGIYYFVDFSDEIEIDQEVVNDFQNKIDSLKELKIAASKPKIYPFNPNFITDYKGYTLGMSPDEIDNLLRFRESGKWINSKADFKKVTGVSDSLLATISPYFKFPEWVTNPKPKKTTYNKDKSASLKKALNEANAEDLILIEGVSLEDAVKIVNYRKRLGGFIEDNQLFDVYGLKNEVVYKVKEEFTVKKKPQIDMINVNIATASDLSTLPYLNFDMARDIVDYRTLNEGIKDISELLKIEGITTYKFDRIKLYLSTNQN